MIKSGVLALCLLLGAASAAMAQKKAGGSPLLPGGDPHSPVNINAERLEYFSKEQKAVYSGHVLARQGDGSMKATVLTIFFTAAPAAGAGAAAPAQEAPGKAAPAAGAPSAAGSQVSHMDAEGPVTIVQKDQVGVGDRATYVRAENKVFLFGNVSLTQGPNVVKGDRLIYDLTTGQAQVVGRVSSLFISGSDTPGPLGASAAPKAKKRAAGAPAHEGRRP